MSDLPLCGTKGHFFSWQLNLLFCAIFDENFFFFLCKSVDHSRKEFFFSFFFLPFSYCAHEAVPDSQFCSRTPQQDSSRTGSLLTTPLRCSKQTYKGKATAWKVIPVPTVNRGRASVADMYPSPLWSSRQVASHLSCCCFL